MAGVRPHLLVVLCIVIITAGCSGSLVGPTEPVGGSLTVEPVAAVEGLDQPVAAIKGTNHTFTPVVNYSAIRHPVVQSAITKADRTGTWTRIQYNATVRQGILESYTGRHAPLIVWYNGTAWAVRESGTAHFG